MANRVWATERYYGKKWCLLNIEHTRREARIMTKEFKAGTKTRYRTRKYESSGRG